MSMWQLKLATKVGGESASAALPKGEIFKKYARYIGLGASVLNGLLGLVYIIIGFIAGWIVGPIMIIIGIGLLVIELPIPLVNRLLFPDIFSSYWKRGGIYALCALPTFFSVITFVAGLASVACGGAYLLAAFKGASGKPEADEESQKAEQKKKEESKKKGKEQHHEEEIHQEEAPEGKNNKKDKKKEKSTKDKKKSLASQGAAPGGDMV